MHINFVGYDEEAHVRGPGSRLAHYQLRGIDPGIDAQFLRGDIDVHDGRRVDRRDRVLDPASVGQRVGKTDVEFHRVLRSTPAHGVSS